MLVNLFVLGIMLHLERERERKSRIIAATRWILDDIEERNAHKTLIYRAFARKYDEKLYKVCAFMCENSLFLSLCVSHFLLQFLVFHFYFFFPFTCVLLCSVRLKYSILAE